MVFTGQNFGAVYSFVDNGGNQVTREYMMKTEVATFADASAAAAAMQPILDALTGATMPKFRVFQEFDNTTFVLPADAGVQVENQASVTFLLEGSGSKKANLNIPAPVIGIFLGNSGPQANIVNLTDASVIAWVAKFLAAADFRISDGEAVARSLSGKRVHKRSSRG
jgi:hypothetical protein